jgi:hypothetical protein
MTRESPRSPLRAASLLYGLLAVLVLSEIAVPRLLGTDAAHFWFEDLPGWGSLYGLASCVAIIVGSKLLGKAWLTRPEKYYDS